MKDKGERRQEQIEEEMRRMNKEYGIRDMRLKFEGDTKGVDQYFEDDINIPYFGSSFLYLYYLKAVLKTSRGNCRDDEIGYAINTLTSNTLKKIKEIE